MIDFISKERCMRLTEDRRTILIREIGISILLVLCLTLLLFTGCKANIVKPEPAGGNLENQEDIDQSNNNSQSSLIGPVGESVIEEDTEATGAVYPQQWATGDGTAENPWANDCIQKAYDACPVGGTIFLKAGYYILSDEVAVTKPINIIGEGRGNTIIVTSIAHGFYLDNVDYVTLQGFTVDGDAQAYYTTFGIAIQNETGGCNYLALKDLEVKNCGKYGIDANSANNSLYQNLYLHDNSRHGIHPGTNDSGRNMYNVYQDISTWNNGSAGFDDVGNQVYPDENQYNVYDNIQAWDNGRSGILISQQRSGEISNCSATNNGTVGFSSYDLEDFNIINCYADNNSKMGIGFELSDNINFTNVTSKNNNLQNSTYAGFDFTNCNNIKLISCQSYDDRETPLQAYGLKLLGTNTGISLLNCRLSPNKNGEIHNPNGSEVTVVKEKMLAKF